MRGGARAGSSAAGGGAGVSQAGGVSGDYARRLSVRRLFPARSRLTSGRLLTAPFRASRDKTLDSNAAAAAVAGVPRIQAMCRRFLVKREYRIIKYDRDIVFDRKSLLSHLSSYSRQRTGYLYGAAYLVFFGLVIALASVALSPSLQYEAGGYVGEQILFYDVTGVGVSFGAHTIHLPSEFYSFLKTGIIAKLSTATVNGKNVLYLGNSGAAQVINPIVLAQHRSLTTECSTLYSVPPSQSVFNEDYCALPLSQGINEETYGSTTNKGFLQTVIPSVDSQYYGSSATKCPNFSWGTSESASLTEGCHSASIPHIHTTTELTSIIEGLERCNFIDHLTRYVIVELDIMSGNERPIYTTFELRVDFSLNGQTFTSWEIITVDVSDPDSNADVKATHTLIITLVVLCALGLVAIAVDCIHLASRSSAMWSLRNTADFWLLLTIIQHALIIASFVLYEAVLDKQRAARSEDISTVLTCRVESGQFIEFKTRLQSLAEAQRSYSISMGLLVFVSFVRLMQYTRHRGMMSLLQRAVMKVVMPITHFFIGTLPLIGGIIAASYLLFGNGILGYSTILWSIQTNLVAIYSSETVTFRRLTDFDVSTAWLFYLVFHLLVVTIVMSFFISIILEGYREMTLMKDTSVTMHMEMLYHYTNFIESHSPFLTSAEQLMWALLHEPGLSGRIVTLRDVKMVLPGLPSKEVAEAMLSTARMRDGGPLQAQAAHHIVGSPYLYFKKKPRYPWIFKYTPGGLAMEAHILFFRVRSVYFLVFSCLHFIMARRRRKAVMVRRRSAYVMQETKGFEMDDCGGTAGPGGAVKGDDGATKLEMGVSPHIGGDSDQGNESGSPRESSLTSGSSHALVEGYMVAAKPPPPPAPSVPQEGSSEGNPVDSHHNTALVQTNVTKVAVMPPPPDSGNMIRLPAAVKTD